MNKKNLIVVTILFLISVSLFAENVSVKEICASEGGHTILLKTDGSIYAWGKNKHGQLGDGSTENRELPTRIGTGRHWDKISTGATHTIALKKLLIW